MREALSKPAESGSAQRRAKPGEFGVSIFHRAWTLLEIVAVLAIVAATLAVALPAVSALMQTSGRRSAIDQVTAMLDRARMCAIAENRPVSFVVADSSVAVADRRFRAAAIFQDNADPAQPPVMITPWRALPTGVRFAATSSSLFDAPPEIYPDGVTAVSFPVPTEGNLVLPHLKFSATGSVVYPADAARAGMVLVTGGPGPAVSSGGMGPNADRIQVSPATGWPRVLSGSAVLASPLP